MTNTIPKQCLTKSLGTKEFTQIPKCLLLAQEFINPFGEVFPLKSSLKLQYVYMYNQYKGFEKSNKSYHEAQQTIADKLGYSLNTVKSNIKLLKGMGLLQVKQVSFNQYNTRVIGIEWIQGTLYNDNIKESKKDKKYKYTFDEYQIIKKNYEQFNKVKQDLTTEYVSIPRKEFLELVKTK